MIRRPPRSTLSSSSAASDVYKRQIYKGSPITDVNTDVGYMTQKDNLLPWRNVRDNIAFPLELAGTPKSEREARADAVIKQVDLDGFETRFPTELSGGMRKRACL